MLVGNKLDLCSEQQGEESKREVEKDEAEEMAKSLHASYYEVSAKNSSSVNGEYSTLFIQCLPVISLALSIQLFRSFPPFTCL